MADDAPLLAALAVIQARGAIGERALVDAGRSCRPVRRTDSCRRPHPCRPRVGGRATRAGHRLAPSRSGGDHGRAQEHSRRSSASSGRFVAARRSGVGRGNRRCGVCRELPHSFDVATARSFAEPAVTAKVVDALLDAHGIGLVSEPPEDRTAIWSRALADGREPGRRWPGAGDSPAAPPSRGALTSPSGST
jgi:hypothetical protein